MTNELVLTNATIVMADQLVTGTLAARGGIIHDVASGGTGLPRARDLEGDLLIPGLVEMHTDNMERHFIPRPRVVWPSSLDALLAHDTAIAGAGITTVYDALFLGDSEAQSPRRGLLERSISVIEAAAERGLLRARHSLHLRCEVCDDTVLEPFERHVANPLVRLVSVMDHTPGQRQWRDMKSFRTFTRRERWSESEIEAMIARRRDKQARNAAPHRRAITERCRALGLPMASHDDATDTHIADAVADGIVIAEFPTTLEATRAARANGLVTIMGAPNLVRGESHSGNVSALALEGEGLVDGYSSDYVPASLLAAAFTLHERLGRPLPEAVAALSWRVAGVLGLADRGAIAPGLRADLVRVHRSDHGPVVRTVWRAGRRVL